jgi:hypothetical protein
MKILTYQKQEVLKAMNFLNTASKAAIDAINDNDDDIVLLAMQVMQKHSNNLQSIYNKIQESKNIPQGSGSQPN